MGIRRKLAATAVVLATTIAPFALTTSSASAAKCGFYTSGGSARYNHCGNNWVTIKVDNWSDRDEWTYCSPPWYDNYLGSTSVVSWAHFARTGC